MDNLESISTLAHLKVDSFRNIDFVEIDPHPGCNIIYGANGQGKTNLLESIHLVSTGRLLRATKDALAIREGQSHATVHAEISPSGTTIRVELKAGVRKMVRLNGASLPRASDVLGRLPSVSFSALDLLIARGEPSNRRHFMDTELAQLYPAYLQHLTVYRKTLAQRNALLRAAQESLPSDELFATYEAILAEHGVEIRAIRRRWTERLRQAAPAAHAQLSAGESLEIRYAPKDDAENADDLLSKLESARSADIQRGFTTCGPHRDDLDVLVEGRLARHFASQGQQRTAVIAIMLATLQSAIDITGAPPILLLDDVFSDLDESRRSSLVAKALDEGGQVFLTCTEPEQAGTELIKRSKLFEVRSGAVRER